MNFEVVLEGDPALSRSYLAKRALVSPPYHHDNYLLLWASLSTLFHFLLSSHEMHVNATLKKAKLKSE